MIILISFKKVLALWSLHEKSRGSDIFEEVKSCLESQQLNLLISHTFVLMEHHQ